MPFQPVSMHSIRSSNQRALAAHWNALASDRGFPAIGAFNPQATDHSPEQMILWDVENNGEAGGNCFRVRKVGLRAVEAIGDSPIGPIGKTMEELAPPPLREISLNGARECVASGCAIYEIITTSMRTRTWSSASGCYCRSETASTWNRSSPRCS